MTTWENENESESRKEPQIPRQWCAENEVLFLWMFDFFLFCTLDSVWIIITDRNSTNEPMYYHTLCITTAIPQTKGERGRGGTFCEKDIIWLFCSYVCDSETLTITVTTYCKLHVSTSNHGNPLQFCFFLFELLRKKIKYKQKKN